MKLIIQHAAALDAMVGKVHADMKPTTHDMRNVQANATNKLEAIHKSEDDMAAKVEEMKQRHIDIMKYVEKKRRESGIGSERSPSPGTAIHNPFHKKSAPLQLLDRVEGTFSTELNEVKKKTTTMDKELGKVENKIQRLGRREEKSKLEDGSDKLHDLCKKVQEMIHEIRKKLSKVDQTIQDNADTHTGDLDDLAVNVQENLGRVKDKIEHHKDDMAKSIALLREELADVLEKCSTNGADEVETTVMQMREEVQSDLLKYRDNVDGKYAEMVNRVQTELADRYAVRMYGSMPALTTSRRTSPFTKATTTFAMSMDAPRDDEETFVATESVEGPSRSMASEAVRPRTSPSWMPAPFREFLYWYNSRETPLQFW